MRDMDDDAVLALVHLDLGNSFARPGDRIDSADDVDRGTVLPPVDGARDAVEILDVGVMSNDTAAAVAWRYTGVHSEVFLGMAPTGRVVEVEGITIVQGTVGDPQLRSLIDWHSVLVQIGAATGGRPVTELPADFPLDDPPVS